MSTRGPCCHIGLFLAVFLVAVNGCSSGPATGDVQGKVTYNGKAVTEARIQFQGTKSPSAAAAVVDSSGNYKLSKVPVGEYLVTIQPVEDLPPAGSVATPPKIKDRPDIPEKYRKQGKSGLTATIAAGDNTFNAEMK